MARSFGTETHEAEDLVQEMYLRMYKYVENPEKIMYNDKEVNTYFEQAHKNLIDELWEEVETWHWYDTKLFKLYHNTDMTIKKISQETKISERSIWNTLDNGRKKIKQKQEKSYKIYKKAKK